MRWMGGVRGRMRVATFVALVCVALAAAAGIAYAAIPNSSNVYSACMLKGVGTIRLIDTSLPSSNLLGHCTALETQISWNGSGQAGPAGPAGPTGQTGQTGPAGPAGPAGAKGNDGATGAPGAQGPIGPAGPAGDAGANGSSVTSVALNTGDDPSCPNGGSKFIAGDGTVTYACNGATGATGAPGPKGDTGSAGSGGGSLASLGSLRGTACTVGGAAGTLSVDVASSGAVTLTCVAGEGGSCSPPAYPNGTTSCDANGNVVYQCNAGYADADGDRTNGCETALVPDALEPNDSTAQASTITAGAIETIAPSGDVDYYLPITGGSSGCSVKICTSTTSISVPGVSSTPGAVTVQLVDGSGAILVANAAGFSCDSIDSTNIQTGDETFNTSCPASVQNASAMYVKVTASSPTAYSFN